MRQLLSIVAILLALVGLGSLSAAEGAKAAKPKNAMGDVVKVEAASITLSVPGKKAKEGAAPAAATEMTFVIDANTVIMVNGAKATVAEVKAGEKAHVAYVEETKAAVEISVGEKAKKEKAPKAKEGGAAAAPAEDAAPAGE